MKQKRYPMLVVLGLLTVVLASAFVMPSHNRSLVGAAAVQIGDVVIHDDSGLVGVVTGFDEYHGMICVRIKALREQPVSVQLRHVIAPIECGETFHFDPSRCSKF